MTKVATETLMEVYAKIIMSHEKYDLCKT